MPYLGRGLEKGNYLKLDDISSQFDGSKTTFNLTVGGSAHVPGSSYSLLVSLSGIVQEGEAAYTLDQNEITFAAAPQAADDCFIISLGTPLGIGVPSNGTVNGTQLAKPLNYDNFFHLDHTNDRVGIGTSLPIQSLDVYDGGIAVRDSATGITTLSFYHNRNVLKASIDKTGNNLTFENVDSGIIDYKIGGESRVSIGSTGKIFFAGDDNTYFYRPGADTLGFLTGGTERLRITSGGDVGIGTNSPDGKLDVRGTIFVNGDGTGGRIFASGGNLSLTDGNGRQTLKIDDPGAGNTHTHVFDSSGNFGVNCTPTAKFDVRRDDADGKIAEFHQSTGYGIDIGSSQADAYISSGYNQNFIFKTDPGSGQVERLRIAPNGKIFFGNHAGTISTTAHLGEGNTFQLAGLSSQDGISVVRFNSSFGTYGLNIGRSKSNTLGTNVALQDGNEIGHVTFWGADGSDYNMAAQISAEVDGDPATGSDGTDMPGALILKTSSEGSGTPTERLRIDSSGVVRIQKTTTNAKLILSRNESVDTTNTVTGVIDFCNNTAHTTNSRIQGVTDGTGNVGGEILVETRDPSNSTLTEKFRIKGNGSVGIGTTNPQKLLELQHVTNRKLQFSYDDNIITIKGANNNGNPETIRLIGGNSIRFHTGATGSGTEQVRITSDDGTQLTRGPQGGRAHTGNTSNFMKIGTWNNIQQQSRLKITVFGVATYDSDANVAGETIIYISSNANYTLKGHFYSVIHGISKRNGIQKVALKYDSSTTPTSCEVWVKYNGSYSQTYHLADASTGYWVGADVNTNSTDVPAGAEEIFSSYSIATSDGSQSNVRVAISSEGHIGIGTHDPQAPVHIDGGTTGTQRLRVQNHASVGAFSGNYGSEFRHATSSANHCMLIHCHEANDDRRTLDISDSNGIFAQFTNGKFGVGTVGNDEGHPRRDVEICSPDGGVLMLSSSDDSLSANERLGGIEFHTDDDDGGHIGAAITAISDASDSFGRRTALVFGTQNTDNPPADAVERLRITAAGTVAVVSHSFALGSPGENVAMQTVTKRGFLGSGSNATLSVGTAYAGGRIVAHCYKTADSTKQTTYYADFQARGTGNGFRTNERTITQNTGVNFSVTDDTKGFKITNNETFTIKYAMMIEIVGDIPVG